MQVARPLEQVLGGADACATVVIFGPRTLAVQLDVLALTEQLAVGGFRAPPFIPLSLYPFIPLSLSLYPSLYPFIPSLDPSRLALLPFHCVCSDCISCSTCFAEAVVCAWGLN
jgi:hypothetical protein